jgi:hypothetical protein
MQEAQQVRRNIHELMYVLLPTTLLGYSSPANAHDEPCWEAWTIAIKMTHNYEGASQP